MLRLALYTSRQKHVINAHFSKEFYHQLLVNVIAQIDLGTNWFDFLSLGVTSEVEDEKIDNKMDTIDAAGKQIYCNVLFCFVFTHLFRFYNFCFLLILIQVQQRSTVRSVLLVNQPQAVSPKMT